MEIETNAEEYKETHTHIFKKLINCFKVSKWTYYDGPADPAGLCDNAEETNMLQIRLDEAQIENQEQPKDNKVVSILIQEREQSELKHFEVPYDKFFTLFSKFCEKEIKNIKREEKFKK